MKSAILTFILGVSLLSGALAAPLPNMFEGRLIKKYGIIKNGINLSKITEVMSLKQQKFLNFASRFRHTK